MQKHFLVLATIFPLLLFSYTLGWGAPINLGPLVNTDAKESEAFMTADGLNLYFDSNRFGPEGHDNGWFDIYRVSRPDTSSPFSNLENLGSDINTPKNDGHAVLTSDQLRMIYLIWEAPDSFGMSDLYESVRSSTAEPFPAPTNLGGTVNTYYNDRTPTLSPDGLTMIFSSTRTGDWDLFYTTRSSLSTLFATAYTDPLVNINSSASAESSSSLSRDGLVLFFESDRLVDGEDRLYDIWYSKRNSTNEPFGTPVNLMCVNTSYNDRGPSLSIDGKILTFFSDRPGGFGDHDVYQVNLDECPEFPPIEFCAPGSVAADDSTCDGIDDDCDGLTDEDYTPVSATCGVGACSVEEDTSCTDGYVVVICTPGDPAADDSTCDGFDDDCDGLTDEDYTPVQTTCGVGSCSAEGQTECVDGAEIDNCTEGSPVVSNLWTVDDMTVNDCGTYALDNLGGVQQQFVQVQTNGVATYDVTGHITGTAVLNSHKQITILSGSYANWSYGRASYTITDTSTGKVYSGTGYSISNLHNLVDSNGQIDPSDDETYGISTGDIHGTFGADINGPTHLVITSINGDKVSGSLDFQITGGTPYTDTVQQYTPIKVMTGDFHASGTVTSAQYDGPVAHQRTDSVMLPAMGPDIGFMVGEYTFDGSIPPGDYYAYIYAGTTFASTIVSGQYLGMQEGTRISPIACVAGMAADFGITEMVVDSKFDVDGDNWTIEEGDCNDKKADINPAAQDICDGLDNDCDCQIDENYMPLPTACGVGACSAEGQSSCVDGSVVDSCTAGEPAADDSVCNGIDDDCDGSVDEDYISADTTCGTGACSAEGQSSCIDGSVVSSCTQGIPAENDATCDGIDDNCNGQTDEEYTPLPTACGVGACSAEGMTSCSEGQLNDNCQPGAPVAETCNGVDDDCDGLSDGSENLTQICGTTEVGTCSFGTETCNDYGVWTECDSIEPVAEICDDSIDSDCNGQDAVSPLINEISIANDLLSINGALVEASASFSDINFEDTHTAIWTWGDGTTSNGIVDESTQIISGDHAYTDPGVYIVTLTVSDGSCQDGYVEYSYVVVYDPEGGFVTGGGWITSPEGAYFPEPLLTGKASFGFVSKYKKGASIPTGTTQFQFKVADLKFHSASYEWLVVAGSKAKYKGIGTINGSGEYKFMLTAIDADKNINDSFLVDRFRIKIWTEDEFSNENVVYDNSLGLEADDATTELGGGSIVVHTK